MRSLVNHRSAILCEMQTLAVISVAVSILSALLVAVLKGSRPLQPIPPTLTSLKQAVYRALISVVCAAVVLVTLTRLGPYLSGLPPPKPLVNLFMGVIAPWFGGIHFAYGAARAANQVLGAIGASEVLIFLLGAALALVSR